MESILLNNKNLLPKHIAIIMDGNGRWAKQHKIKIALGHRNGVLSLRKIIRFSEKIGIKQLSLYAFSTENWKRSDIEVAALMQLIDDFFENDIEELHQKNVRVNIIGDIMAMPEKQAATLLAANKKTCQNTGMILNIAINYGGRAEIIRACKSIAQGVQAGEIKLADIDQELFAQNLYTHGQDDVDLLIRTSGELRLSNFLLYQCAYAEFSFPKTLWPDFSVEEYSNIILEYMQRDRRFGGRNKDED